jgi:transposase
MSNRRLELSHYRQALHLMRHNQSDRAIAKRGLMGREKAAQVRAAAAEEGWLKPGTKLPDDAALATRFDTPKRRTAGPSSSLAAHRTRIEQWVEQDINGRVIHRVLRESHGYIGSYSSVNRMIKRITADKPPAVTTVMEFEPGHTAQIDFGKGPEIIDQDTGEVCKTWFFVMVLAWSRHLYAELVTDQSIETWLGCHRRAFEHFGGVPAVCSVDNLKAAVTRACYHDPLIQRAYADCAEGYGFIISPCPVADPKKKGRVESGVKYVKNNFTPLRTFRHLADANAQLMQWVMSVAGTREHGTTRVAPLTRFVEIEQPLLKPLPAKPPELASWAQAKLHGDCHIQVQKRRYSAPYRLVGQSLDVRQSETTVRLYHQYQLVATHPRLKHAGQRSTVEDHLPPEHLAYKMRDPTWCRTQSEQVGPSCQALIERLFADGIVERLRAAQGIIRLRKRHGDARLEAACRRALAFENIGYNAVKTILNNGLDQVTDPIDAFDQLSDAYTGGARFCRHAGDLFGKH